MKIELNLKVEEGYNEGLNAEVRRDGLGLMETLTRRRQSKR